MSPIKVNEFYRHEGASRRIIFLQSLRNSLIFFSMLNGGLLYIQL